MFTSLQRSLLVRTGAKVDLWVKAVQVHQTVSKTEVEQVHQTLSRTKVEKGQGCSGQGQRALTTYVLWFVGTIAAVIITVTVPTGRHAAVSRSTQKVT